MRVVCLLALASVAAAGPNFTQLPINDLEWSVDFVSNDYTIDGDGKYVTEWKYSVGVCQGQPKDKCQDLSHWVIEFPVCSEFFTVESSSSPYGAGALSGDADPTTGIPGLKYDQGQPSSTTAVYTVTTKSDLPLVKADKRFSVKGSTRFGVGVAPVAACQVKNVPQCSVAATAVAECDGTPPRPRVALSALSSHHFTAAQWSVSDSDASDGISFDDAESSSTSLLLPSTMCAREVVVTLTVSDNDGQSDSCQTTVSFSDSDAPVLGNLYQTSLSVESGDVPTAQILSASDSCDASVEVLSNEVQSETVNGAYSITRTWVAADHCSNSVTAQQVIQVSDTTPPVLAGVEPDETASCDAVPPPCEPVTEDETATVVEYSQTRHDGDCAHDYSLFRVWTATDEAGNKVTKSQTIVVTDDVAPVLVGAPTETQVSVDCDSVPTAATVTATDNCSPDGLSVNFVEVRNGQDDGSPNSFTIVRTWSATDSCGNSASASQTVTVSDESAPVFTIPPEEDKTVECSALPPPCVVEIEDNCDLAASVEMTSETRSGTCPFEYEIVYTWTARDSAGNVASMSQTITVEDNTAPALHGKPEAALSVQCNNIPQVSVTATDNCDDNAQAILSENSTPGSCEDEYGLERVWTATDGCGNSDSYTQSITVTDDEAPTLEGVPQDAPVSCNQVPEEADVEGVDNCDDNVAVTFKETSLPGNCPHSYRLVRKWTATDNCGSQSTDTQTLTVDDNEKPVMVGLPGNLAAVKCDAVPDAPTVTATDNCGDVSVLFTEETIEGSCPCEYTLKRTWSVTDLCGNGDSHVQTIEVVDNDPPVISEVPAHTVVECDDVPSQQPVTCSDEQDGDLIPVPSRTTAAGTCPEEYTITHKWTCTDACGNQAVETQTVTVMDRVSPEYNDDLQSIVVNLEYCEDVIPDPLTVTATDNCAFLTPEMVETTQAAGCPNNQIVKRVWDVEDHCGNSPGPKTRTFNMQDTTPPTFTTSVSPATFQCDETPTVPTVEAEDCNAPLTVVGPSDSAPQFSCADSYTFTRTWTVADACANTATLTQLVTVEDTTPPVLVVPVDQTIDCLNGVPDLVASATDNCAAAHLVSVTKTGPVTTPVSPVDSSRIFETQVWTYTAVDRCGNSVQDTLTVYVKDTTPPELHNLEGNMNEDCGSILTPPNVYATDDCDSPTVDFTQEEFPGACDAEGFIVRKWSVTDHVGLTTTGAQTITIEDTTPPTFVGLPSDVTVILECDEDEPSVPTVTAEDDCGSASVTSDSEVIATAGSNNPGEEYSVIRTWHAEDDCGNEAFSSQTIVFEDTTPPSILTPIDETIGAECTEPAAITVSAEDNCGPVTVTPSEVSAPGSCPSEYTVTRTWVATDLVGHSVTSTQTVHVTDDTDPEWVQPLPVDVVVYDGVIPTMHDYQATDNCGAQLTPVPDEGRTDGCSPDEYTLNRSATVTDECGHTIDHAYTVTVKDTTPPYMVGQPTEPSKSFTCEDTVVLPEVTCDGVVVQPFSLGKTFSPGCALEYSETFTWSCQDTCGNPVDAQYTVTVGQSGPTISGVADWTSQCTSVPANPPAAADDCDTPVPSPNALPPSSNQVGDALPFEVSYSWVVQDSCGLSATATATETVEDTTPPTIDIAIGAETIEYTRGADVALLGLPASTDVTYDDNCGAEVTWSSATETGTCLYAYTMVNTYVATDYAGNTATTSVTMTVEDTTPPVLNNVPLADETYFSYELPVPPAATVTASDPVNEDDAPLVVTYTDETLAGASEDEFQVSRTWEVEDACGNAATHQQLITVKPTTIPFPPDISRPCDDDAPTTLDEDITTIETYLVDNYPEEGYTVAGTEVSAAGTCASEMTITRTFTVTDGALNVATGGYTISFVDELPPVFGQYTSPVTNECSDPVIEPPTAEDNCHPSTNPTGAATVTHTDSAHTDGGIPPYSFTRTYVATDDCGHTSTATQLVQVTDNTPPTVDVGPADATYECTPEDAVADGSDNCGHDVTVTGPVESNESIICGTSRTFTRTWTITDASGNTSPVTQAVTVADSSDPVWTGTLPPASVSYQCSPEPATPPVANDCDGTLNGQLSDPEGPNPGTWVRSWTATDACGNTVQHEQSVTVEDTTPPTFVSTPPDANTECEDGPEITATATDNCGPVTVEMTPTSEAGDCVGEYILKRTYVATDSAGNTATYVQTVTSKDTTPPSLSLNPSLAEQTLTCGDALPVVTPTYSDACDPNPTLTPTSETTVGTCDNEYVVARSWVVTDDCGLSSTASTVVTYADDEAPALQNAPLDDTVRCGGDAGIGATLVATDNCVADQDVQPSETSSAGTCDNEVVHTRTWVVDDGCGNSDTAVQVVTIIDDEPPTLTVPDDETYECTADDSTATATDDCEGSVDPVYLGETELSESRSNLSEYSVVRTWSATDACGNSVTDSQTVTLEDTTPPTIGTLPEDSTADCAAPPTHTDAGASDTCDSTVSTAVLSSQSSAGTCVDERTLVLTWVATDAAGNTATDTRTVQIEDNTPPTWDTPLPEDQISDECEVPAPEIPEASDLCDETPAVTWSENPAYSSGGASITVRVFTATDNCGNTAETRQTVTVKDITPPTITSLDLSPWSGSCGDCPGQNTPVYDDNCEVETSSLTEVTVPGTCDDDYAVVQTWVVTDTAGNSATATRTLQHSDTTVPEINVSADANDQTLPCKTVVGVPTLTYTDNCDDNHSPVLGVRTEVSQQCPQQLVDSWDVTDDCGNVDSHSRTISLVDNDPPTLDEAPDNRQVGCDAVPPMVTLSATDTCDETVDVVPSEVTNAGSCPYDYKIVRTWTAADVCGNAATEIQTVTVVDEEPPTLSEVASDTYECDPPAVPTVTATDNCATAVSVVFEGEQTTSSTSSHDYVMVRTWSATDECGLSATRTATVTVEDTTPPTIVMPADLTAECDAVPSLFDEDVVVTEECSTATLVCTVVTTPGTCTHAFTITRTCVATDVSGNESTAEQVVTVEDTEAPSISGVLPDSEAEYNAGYVPLEEAQQGVSAWDECAHYVTVTPTEESIGGTCDFEFELRRTYTASDDCGNTATDTETVTVKDTTPCVFNDEPADVTVECDAIPDQCKVMCEDDDGTTVIESQDATGRVFTWTATDDCGNTQTHSQSISTEDTTPPVLSRLPADETAECDCDSFPAPPVVVAFDNCDSTVTVDFTEAKVPGANEDNYELHRTWVATDNAGNEQKHTQIVTIQDTTAPSLDSVPEALTVECDDVPAQLALRAYDNCDDTIAVTKSSAVVEYFNGEQSACDAHRIIRNTWSATDRSGHTVSDTQDVTVQDTKAPEHLAPSGPDTCIEANGQYYQFTAASTELFPARDDCGSVVTSLLSCVSTEPKTGEDSAFTSDCHYDSASDSLFIKGETNSYPNPGPDRTYSVYASLTDECGNSNSVSRTFVVPSSLADLPNQVCKRGAFASLPGSP